MNDIDVKKALLDQEVMEKLWDVIKDDAFLLDFCYREILKDPKMLNLLKFHLSKNEEIKELLKFKRII